MTHATPVELSEYIFETSPFPSCHASTIAHTGKSLVAAWFGGIREFDPGVGIWVSRRENNLWCPPQEVANGLQYVTNTGYIHRYACWNPVLFQIPDGPLWLFYKVGKSPQTWWGMLMKSNDAGKTWSQPVRLPEGIDGPVKNKPVQLSNGDILCPTSTEETMATGWKVHFERTRDQGASWVRTNAVNDGIAFGAIQPSILVHGNGRLQAIGRTQLAKRLFSVWSEDGGDTWGEMSLLDIPNPDSGTDAVSLKDGRHALIYNHDATHKRQPLNLAISHNGIEWKSVLELEPLGNGTDEFSYPSIIQGNDGLLHMTYTWKRQRIKYVAVDPAKL